MNMRTWKRKIIEKAMTAKEAIGRDSLRDQPRDMVSERGTCSNIIYKAQQLLNIIMNSEDFVNLSKLNNNIYFIHLNFIISTFYFLC
jgi:hypothetical protein